MSALLCPPSSLASSFSTRIWEPSYLHWITDLCPLPSSAGAQLYNDSSSFNGRWGSQWEGAWPGANGEWSKSCTCMFCTYFFHRCCTWQSVIHWLSITALCYFQVLFEYMQRCNSVGWLNRPQFEERWMQLLGVINQPLPAEGTHPEEYQAHSLNVCAGMK